MREYLFGWRKFNIRNSDIVLEIGSGNYPWIRSDILCDKYIASSYERAFRSPIVIDRPFVIADAIKLPFKDKSIDFLYSSDLAEHLDRPDLFFEECNRIANRGCIKTPSALAERLIGWDYHSKMFEIVDGAIIIHNKTKDNWGWFGNTFHKLWKEDRKFRKIVRKREDLFRMVYVWEKSIKYRQSKNNCETNQLWRKVFSSDRNIEFNPGLLEQIKIKARSFVSVILRKFILRRRNIDK